MLQNGQLELVHRSIRKKTYSTLMPLAIATELTQGLDESAQLTSHLRALARRVLFACHSRVCCIDGMSTVYLELNEPLLVLGKCIKRLPLSANLASISSIS